MKATRIVTMAMDVRNAPLVALSSVTDSAVHIHTCEPLPLSLKERLKSVIDRVGFANKQGADLVIEDPTGLFSSYGRALRLEDKDYTGKPVLVTAMDKFRPLNAAAAITLPPDLAHRFTIPDDVYNIKHGANGTAQYEINWPRLNDEARLLLLTIHAGLCFTPYQSGYFERMTGHLADIDNRTAAENIPSKPLNDGTGARITLL